ncbi:RecX family transcriptional regulator [Paenibacillus sp. FSL R5-0407]|uniref:regulatory protein RecX n=1 Tax=Paenibacillus sp. FSL R5-0407 TaxID=2975320 RepID=UPI0030FB5BF1
MDQRYGSRGSRPKGQQGRKDEPGEIVDISDESFWEMTRGTAGGNSSNELAGEGGGDGIDAFPEDIELAITSVSLLKRPKFRYRISFGSYSLEVHEDVMIKYRMIKGAVFTKSELEEIVFADERQQAYADALHYLSRKPRTAYEITMRLGEKGWGEETAAEVVRRLTEDGLVNDAAYAQEWAGQRVRGRGKGKLWVRHELRQKGVPKPLIEEALQTVSEDDEFESAMELAAKKWRTSTGEPADRKRKTGSFLMRRGYSGSLVSRVIRELGREDGFSDEEEWEND